MDPVSTERLFALAYLAGIAWIACWEAAAFAVNTRYTLSELTWAWEGGGWTFGRYLVLVFLAWLTLHLSFGWLR